MDEEHKLSEQVLAIANVTRKCVLIGNKKITEAIEESPFSEYEVDALLQFAERFMQGAEKDVIIDELQISIELERKFDKYKLAW